jgi:hypothetical protein
MDAAKRLQILEKVHRLVLDEIPAVFLMHRTRLA